MLYPWSSLVEGGEGSFLPNCQTNLVIALYTLSLLFCKFINTTAYHLGRYKPSSHVSCRAPWLSCVSFLFQVGISHSFQVELSHVASKSLEQVQD